MEPKETSIKVVIRVRPLNQRESDNNNQNIWQIDTENNCIYSKTQSNKQYAFDRIYAPSHSTKDIYNDSMIPVITSFIDGFSSTIFAYGQTSSGKTYTMMGSGLKDGIIYRAINHIFKILSQNNNRQYSLRVSYLEIYNETIKDLLNPNDSSTVLKISVDPQFGRPIVLGLKTEAILSKEKVFKVLKQGMSNRNIGATKMNATSSRSHTIFQLYLESRFDNSDDSNPDFDGSVRSSILNIVDLAGSERQKKTENSGKRLKEGCAINTSLLTLGIVIKKLSELAKKGRSNGTEHIPYRDSKLTHILEPALGGNSKTVVICTMTPADIHEEESISTLGFASRAKDVKNHACVTEVTDLPSVIARQKKYIQELEHKLQSKFKGGSDNHNSHNSFDSERAEYEQKINRLKAMCTSDSISNNDSVRGSGKKESVLGKRRRHSISLAVIGSPARKRMKTQIIRNLPIKTRHSSFATPMNKIKCERDCYENKLRREAHISKSLQQEVNAKYKDLSAMQDENEKLSEQNLIYAQKIEFYESNIENKDKDLLMENQRLTLKINELNNAILLYKAESNNNITNDDVTHHLNREISEKNTTITALEGQVRELRLNIETQNKMTESFKASSLETSIDTNDANHLQMQLLQMKNEIVLIKNDKVSIQQKMKSETNKIMFGFQKELMNKMRIVQCESKDRLHRLRELNEKLVLCADEKKLFESQYHQLRTECEELREEVCQLQRPENEIIEELQTELLTIHQQSDIDNNHSNNVQMELGHKSIEIENLKELNKDLKKSMSERECKVREECANKINDLKAEMNVLKQLNQRLESDINNVNVSNSVSNSKIDSMNIPQLKGLYKNTKRTVRELQTKLASIERKKSNCEKTAQKYTKRCNDLEQRLKMSQRECNNTKNTLSSANKENRSLKNKNEKYLSELKKFQNNGINSKDLNRKLKMSTKHLESLQKKYDSKCHELTQLKQEKSRLCKEINELRDSFNNGKKENERLCANIKDLEGVISTLNTNFQTANNSLENEKKVIDLLKTELKKFHQINGGQSLKLTELNETLELKQKCIADLQSERQKSKDEISKNTQCIKEKNEKLHSLSREMEKLTNLSREKEQDLLKQIESLKLNVSAMKEIDINQRNEIDETNKMLVQLQIELNENKKELSQYQNRWQNERKENDLKTEKLRAFELRTNNLLHEKQMNKTSIDNKDAEIDRLNTEFKTQQQSLLNSISANADLKIELENTNNDLGKLKQENILLCDEKLRLAKSIENKDENISELNTKLLDINGEIDTLQNEIKSNRHKMNEYLQDLKLKKNEIKAGTESMNDLNKKYEKLQTKNKERICDLNKRETEIMGLNEKIQDLYNAFEKEKKSLNYKLNKKISELNETSHSLCDLEKEFKLKCSEIDSFAKSQKEQNGMYNNIQRDYNALLLKYEKCESELKDAYHKCKEMNEKYKNAMNQCENLTFASERLKDNININNSAEHSLLQKKYAKAKEMIAHLNSQMQIAMDNQSKMTQKIEKWKKREQHYVGCCEEWKSNAEASKVRRQEYKKQIAEMEEELQRLRPSKSKMRNFKKICDDYHFAKTNKFKASCICRETQTYECRLPNYRKENKENINTNTNSNNNKKRGNVIMVSR